MDICLICTPLTRSSCPRRADSLRKAARGVALLATRAQAQDQQLRQRA